MTRELISMPLAVVLSDVHLGDPRNRKLVGFEQDSLLLQLVAETLPKRVGWPLTLIFAGDLFDLVQVLPELSSSYPEPPLGPTEGDSVRKMSRVIEAHTELLGGLQTFLQRGGQLLFLPGNRDLDLHFPAVWHTLVRALGQPSEAQCQLVSSGVIQEKGVHIEHGHQLSSQSLVLHPQSPLLPSPEGLRLERPWSSQFIDALYKELPQAYALVNSVQPISHLGWLALRHGLADEQVSLPFVAFLMRFFLGSGRAWFQAALTGSGSEASSLDAAGLMQWIAPTMNAQRKQKLLELLADLQKRPMVSEPEPPKGLLGRVEEQHAQAYAEELLRSETVQAVVLGHTHMPMERAPFGTADPRREVHLGGWTPQRKLDEKAMPSWAELHKMPSSADYRYAVIRWSPRLEVSLEKAVCL